jgi:hypothetical protein
MVPRANPGHHQALLSPREDADWGPRRRVGASAPGCLDADRHRHAHRLRSHADGNRPADRPGRRTGHVPPPFVYELRGELDTAARSRHRCLPELDSGLLATIGASSGSGVGGPCPPCPGRARLYTGQFLRPVRVSVGCRATRCNASRWDAGFGVRRIPRASTTAVGESGTIFGGRPTEDNVDRQDRTLSKQIVVRLDGELLDQLKDDAEANGRTLAQTVRFLLSKQFKSAA